MGLEAKCTMKFGKQRRQGLARLEEKELLFKGPKDFRLKIPLQDARADAKHGALIVTWPGGMAQFDLRAAAETWALKIRLPRSRMDKLGAKPGMRVSVLGVLDKSFWSELEARTESISDGQAQKDSELIFFVVNDASELKKLRELQKAIVPAGAIWVVWPKGQPHIKEEHIRAAASSANLVDVKVCAFSDARSALKLMIPRAKR
jgi:hypothetical protein